MTIRFVLMLMVPKMEHTQKTRKLITKLMIVERERKIGESKVYITLFVIREKCTLIPSVDMIGNITIN